LIGLKEALTAAAPALAAHHALDARVAAVLGPPARARIGLPYRLVLAAWFVVAIGGARRAEARRAGPVCDYTTQMAEALFAAYPEADLDGDGRLSREEACGLQAALQSAPGEATRTEPVLETFLTEPLCCNCDEGGAYSTPANASCQNQE